MYNDLVFSEINSALLGACIVFPQFVGLPVVITINSYSWVKNFEVT